MIYMTTYTVTEWRMANVCGGGYTGSKLLVIIASTTFVNISPSLFRRLLLKAYQTRDGNVNYRTMHADCAHGGKHESDGGFDARGVSVQVLSARRVDDQLQQQREQEQQQQEQRHRMTENRHMDTAHGGDR